MEHLSNEEILQDLKQENQYLRKELSELCEKISMTKDNTNDTTIRDILFLQASLSEEKKLRCSMKSRMEILEAEIKKAESANLQLTSQIDEMVLQNKALLSSNETLRNIEKENVLLSSANESMTNKIEIMQAIIIERNKVVNDKDVLISRLTNDLQETTNEKNGKP